MIITDLDIHKLDEGKPEACHGDFVFDEDDTPHTFATLHPRASSSFDGLMNSLRTREKIEAPKKENWPLCISDVSGAIVRVGTSFILSALVMGRRTLRVVDLDSSPIIRCVSCLEGLVKGGGGRRAVRSWWGDVDKREEGVDESSCVLGSGELGKSEAL